MAGIPAEAVERGDTDSRSPNPDPPAYRCNHPSAAQTSPPHCSSSSSSSSYMLLPRGDGLDAGARHLAIEAANAQLDASSTDEKPPVYYPDDVPSDDNRITLHRSNVVDGLSRGDWSFAESSLAALLDDLHVPDTDSPDLQILQAMVHNGKARWQDALDVLEEFEHQSVSEPELSTRAYYAKAVAFYKLKDYETAHLNARRGLTVVDRFLEGAVQQRYQSAFGDLARRTLDDLGRKADAGKAQLYKSLVAADHTPDPILAVTPVQDDHQDDNNDNATYTQPRSKAEKTRLREAMQQHRLSFGHDGKVLVGRPKDFFNALHDALDTDNVPLMTLICSNDWCATESLRDSPISFDLEPPMPQYAWRATTLLHVVAGSRSRYSAGMAELLLDRGADPQQTLFEGITPLHVCARQTNAEVAAVLIRRGADIEARSITGKPPIHFAAWKASWNADVRILRMLVAAGANINAKNSGGYTALHWCMFDGRSAAPIEVLLKRPEIDRFVRAANHKTPWDIFWEHEEELLRKGEEKRVQILYTLQRYGITR